MLCSSKKFERMVREATDICLRVLKESNKSRFDSFSRYEQCIDHIPYYLSGLSRAHFFRQPFSKQLYTKKNDNNPGRTRLERGQRGQNKVDSNSKL